MAQPLFDEHPLEEYFRQSGETAEPMPGGHSHFQLDAAIDGDSPTQVRAVLDNLPPFFVQAIYFLNTLLSSSKFPSSQNAFAERFKYDVISSSLLSTSIPSCQPTPLLPKRQSLTPEIPGRLPDDTPDISLTGDNTPVPPGGDSQIWSPAQSEPPGMTLPVSILSAGVLALSAEYYFLALFLLAVALYLVRTANAQASRAEAMNLTVKTLDELISSGNQWDSVVNEAMTLIERDERRPSSFYGPTSPQSPFSPLRVALQSSLHTTQTQCDNVRHLLAALTSPAQLSQLSEMYAPASPARPASLQLEQISSPNFSSPHTRPLSDPVSLWRKRRSSLVGDSKTSPMNKRATWNGSYLSLAHAGSSQAANAPSGIPVLSRKADRRRSELGSLFSPPRTRVLSAPSAPLSPRILADVQEETDGDASDNRLSVSLVEDDEDEEQRNDIPVLKEKGYFGIAALDLQRKRRSMGMEAFRLSSLPSSPTPPPRYLPSSPTPRSSYSFSFHKYQSSGSPSPPPTLSSSTRFTLPHTSRHPLSLSALRLALHGALASKRYASSHLLALRFDEEEGEDESYWEDVRSVMSLLVGALGDASGRLKEALDDTEKRKDRDATISPPRTHLDDSDNADLKKKWEGKARSMAEMISFAPMPSHLTRFAAHVDAISSALNDARSHLEETVAAIRDPSPLSSRSTSSTSSTPTSPTTATPTPQPHAPRSGLEASAALQAYDRLRKELGYALRECERGRDRLIDILNPPRPSNPEPEDISDDDGMADRDSMMATPPLVLDTSSDSSSRIGSASLQGSLGLDFTVVETTGSASDELDDVTRHLLLSTSSECLPPAGVEQVYEADSADLGLYRRERSTLSREERIKLAKARRESAKGLISGVGRNSLTVQDDGEGGGGLRRGWSGPGGEVVQELKDVIWKVGEKRRRMSELASMPVATPANLADGDATLPLSALPTIITGEEEYLEFSRMGRMSLPPLPSILDAFEPPEGGDEGVFETGEEVLS